MNGIKAYHSSDYNLLLVDTDNELYILGDNNSGKTSVQSTINPIRNTPAKLNIRLGTDEIITNFKSYPKNIYFTTSAQKLYILRSSNTVPYAHPYRPNSERNWYLQSETNQIMPSPLDPPRCPLDPSIVTDDQAELAIQEMYYGVTESHRMLIASDSQYDTMSEEECPCPIVRRRDRRTPPAPRIANVPVSFSGPNRTPLSEPVFDALLPSLRSSYIDALRRDLNNGLDTNGFWTQNPDLVSRALNQIDTHETLIRRDVIEDDVEDDDIDDTCSDCSCENSPSTARVRCPSIQIGGTRRTSSNPSTCTAPCRSRSTSPCRSSPTISRSICPTVDEFFPSSSISPRSTSPCRPTTSCRPCLTFTQSIPPLSTSPCRPTTSCRPCPTITRSISPSVNEFVTVADSPRNSDIEYIESQRSNQLEYLRNYIQDIRSQSARPPTPDFSLDSHTSRILGEDYLSQTTSSPRTPTPCWLPRHTAHQDAYSRFTPTLTPTLTPTTCNVLPDAVRSNQCPSIPTESQSCPGMIVPNQPSGKKYKSLRDCFINSKISSFMIDIGRSWAENETYKMIEVEGVLFGKDVILYRMKEDGRFILETINFAVSGTDMKLFSQDELRKDFYTIGKCEDQPSCSELCLEFKPDTFVFTEKYLYLRHGDMHYIIVPNYTLSKLAIWYRFKFPFDFDPKQMHIVDNITLFVIHDGFIWTYNEDSCELEKYVSCDATYFFTDLSDPFFVDQTGLYLTNTRRCSYHYYLDSIVKINSFDVSKSYLPFNGSYFKVIPIVIVDAELTYTPAMMTNRIAVMNFVIFVNIRNIKWWGFVSQSIFACIDDTTIHIISGDSTYSREYGYGYYVPRRTTIPIFNGIATLSNMIIPDLNAGDITNVTFDGTIVITTRNHYLYAFPHDNFALVKIPRCQATQTVRDLESLLSPHTATFTHRRYSSRFDLEIQDWKDLLPRFISIAELLPLSSTISIKRVDCTRVESSGHGVTMSFFCDALHEFSDKFIIKHNHMVTWNLEVLSSYTKSQLYVLGKSLLKAFANTECHLPIRLPLMFLAALKKRGPSIRELEYFAYHEDAQAFSHLQEIMSDPAAMSKAGFTNYHKALAFICKYDTYHDIQLAAKVSRDIALAFQASKFSENVLKVNMPTMDRDMCGPYMIDIVKLMQSVQIDGSQKHQARIRKIISNLSQDKLNSLLRNWTGTNAIVPGATLYITISENSGNVAINFSTCGRMISIRRKFLEKCSDDMELESLLTSECKTLVA